MCFRPSDHEPRTGRPVITKPASLGPNCGRKKTMGPLSWTNHQSLECTAELFGHQRSTFRPLRHAGPAVLIRNRELVEMGFVIFTVSTVALVAGADGVQQSA